MKTYFIYRTPKGNLTFKLQEEVAYTIHAKSKEGAENMLKHLKDVEKRKNNEE
jgi:hypothetical protein